MSMRWLNKDARGCTFTRIDIWHSLKKRQLSQCCHWTLLPLVPFTSQTSRIWKQSYSDVSNNVDARPPTFFRSYQDRFEREVLAWRCAILQVAGYFRGNPSVNWWGKVMFWFWFNISTLFESEASFSRFSEGRTGEVHEYGFSNYSEINIPDLQLLFKILWIVPKSSLLMTMVFKQSWTIWMFSPGQWLNNLDNHTKCALFKTVGQCSIRCSYLWPALGQTGEEFGLSTFFLACPSHLAEHCMLAGAGFGILSKTKCILQLSKSKLL